jgi:hypothetical protein
VCGCTLDSTCYQQCGQQPNGCGGYINCGGCGVYAICIDGYCESNCAIPPCP